MEDDTGSQTPSVSLVPCIPTYTEGPAALLLIKVLSWSLLVLGDERLCIPQPHSLPRTGL